MRSGSWASSEARATARSWRRWGSRSPTCLGAGSAPTVASATSGSELRRRHGPASARAHGLALVPRRRSFDRLGVWGLGRAGLGVRGSERAGLGGAGLRGAGLRGAGLRGAGLGGAGLGGPIDRPRLVHWGCGSSRARARRRRWARCPPRRPRWAGPCRPAGPTARPPPPLRPTTVGRRR